MTAPVKVKQPSAADLNHEEFCLPQVGLDGQVGAVRVETFVTERVNPMTGQPAGKVRVLRCIECGAQRNTTIEGALS